jgi:DNA-binding transcriptional regulator GbsR (MarR family)
MTTASNRTTIEDEFILHWGEMGGRWGINRAIAQIHALLLVSESDLTAQEISERLSLARSNVSTGLRELQTWGLISVVHRKGDRREFFRPIRDSWEMFSIIVERRVQRELEPTLACLERLSANAREKPPAIITELEKTLRFSLNAYHRLRGLPRPVIKQLMKLDSRVTRFLGSKSQETIRKDDV